ncbi:MAG TPA: response regulator [bacterium]|nr:response regulator [bacterium]
MAKKIFIADDEVDIMEMYAEALRDEGHEIVGMALNGEEAVRQFAALRERPDVVLLDHRMPVKTGLEAAREILALDPAAYIIFASADSSVEDEARAIGAAAFKKKPFSVHCLVERIGRI